MRLVPGAGPACGLVFRYPGEADRSGGELELFQGVAGGIAAGVIGQREVGNRHRDPQSRPETPGVEIAGSLGKAFGQVFAEILYQGEAAMLGRALGRIDVDVAFAHHLAPAETEQIDILATDDGQVPVPGAALLVLGDGDIGPARQTDSNQAYEACEIAAGPLEVGHVLPVGQGQEMIGIGGQDEMAKARTGATHSARFILVAFC